VRELEGLEEQIALSPPLSLASAAVKLRHMLRNLGSEHESDAPCLQQVVEFLNRT